MTEENAIDKINADIDKVRANLGQLESDGRKVSYIIEKLDTAVERLSQVAGDFSRLIAVHENRIVNQERISSDILVKLDQRRYEVDMKFEQISSRISIENDNLKKHIDSLVEKQNAKIKEIETTNSKKAEAFEAKLNQMERFQWILTGIGTAVAFVAAQFANVIKLFVN